MACFCSNSHLSFSSFPSVASPTSSQYRPRYGLELPGIRTVFSCIARQEKQAHQKKSFSKKRDNVAVEESKREQSERRTKRENTSTRSHKENSYSTNSPKPSSIPLPSPPAGFILNKKGEVDLMAPPSKRVATIVDPANGQSLECLIRRVFSSSDGRQCFLLCPLDTPVQILRIEGEEEDLNELTDEELEDIFPTAAYELAKRRLHLVSSGYCLTIRGGFCYSEDEVMDLNTAYGEGSAESLHEGVEVASFTVKNSEYLIYTPFDPLMFVAYKNDETGELVIADDELLEDEAALDAIDEEKEFQVFMEEEMAVNESLREIAE